MDPCGAASTAHSPWKLRVALVACAMALTALALWPALRGELVYDDLWLVARNPALASWSALSDALGKPHWEFVEPETALHVGYWRPLAIVALFVGRSLGGGSPLGYHALSLALHLASVAVAFLLAERLARDTWIAFAAALLFGLYPLQVESVAWISAVNDPLSGLLVLGALLAFVRWRQRGSCGVPIAASVAFFLALLAKESAVAWLLLAPLTDLARGERLFARPFARAYLAPLAAVLLYGLARVAVFGEASAGFFRITSYLFLPAAREVSIRLELLGGALKLLVWPFDLNLFREVRPEVPWSDRTLLIAIAAIVLWSAACFVAWRKNARVVFAAMLFAPVAIVPAVLRFQSVGRFPLSDRFLYIPVFGVALAAATVALRSLPRIAAAAVVAALSLTLALTSHARTKYWKDELTVFQEGAKASPRSMYVQWGLGRVLLESYQRTGNVQHLFDARDAFTRAQDIALEKPPDPAVLVTPFDEIQSSLGLGWYMLFCAVELPQECSLEEAELVFREMVRKTPDNSQAHCGLGVTLQHLQRWDEAEAELKEAVRVDPKSREGWYDLGLLYLQRERWGDALAQFQRVTELAPDDADAWLRLGIAAIESNLPDRARQGLARARALAPNSPEPLVQLGNMAAREQRFDVALDFFERALKLDGSHGPAYLARAKALVALQRPVEAIQSFLDAGRWLQEGPRETTRLRQTFEAFYNAGVLTWQTGHPREALPMLEEALRRDPEGRWSPGLKAEIEKLREGLPN